jgi:3-hydroxyacyl-CoA dehydrogenase/enoyl-CoA hydratase/3-hydroxybutyryl-CoA epimerase
MLNYTVDADGIATLEWDYPGKSQNILNEASLTTFVEACRMALADSSVRGLLVCSAKKDFIAGGDLGELAAVNDAAVFHAAIGDWQKFLRALELGGKPVAAALNGSALGGGMELALAFHYRVAADNPKARFGFPEVTLGLLPGAGGTQRLPRLIGMQAAAPLLMEGKRIAAGEALKIGMIHAVVPMGEERQAARKWLLDTIASGEKPLQPWDRKGFKVPGGGPNTPNGMQMFMAANAMLREKTFDNYPAPKHILSCIYEGLATDFDTGLAIEARYFTNLALSPVAKNMIRSLFFGMQDANKLASRPADVPRQAYSKDRHARRRHDGCGDRDVDRCGRHRGSAARYDAGSGRKRQGLCREAVGQAGGQGAPDAGGNGRPAGPHPSHGCLLRFEGLRTGHRSRVRAARDQGGGDAAG